MAKPRHLNRRGETLVETLCAVLVMALAVALLGGMITAAFRLDKQTDQATAQLYEAFGKAEEQKQGDELASGTIIIKVGTDNRVVTVDYYGDYGQMTSYRLRKTTPEPEPVPEGGGTGGA